MNGAIADIELAKDDEEGQVVARCIGHHASSWECTWTEIYDTWDDATEYATDHADNGRQK